MGGPTGYRTNRPPLAIGASALCRRAGRGRYCRDRSAGARRGRAGHGRLRSPAGWSRAEDAVRAGAPLVHDGHRGQRLSSRCAWAMPRRSSRPSPARAHDPAVARQQPHHRGDDGAARLHCRVRSRHPPLDLSPAARSTCTASARPWRIRYCTCRKAASASSRAMSAAASA